MHILYIDIIFDILIYLYIDTRLYLSFVLDLVRFFSGA